MLLRCSYFHSLHLLSAILFLIVYLQPNFLCYWFALKYILIVHFLYELVSSIWAFSHFWALAFVGILLLGKDAFFKLSHFFQKTSNFHANLNLALGLVGMYTAATFIWAVTKLSYLSFVVCLLDISWTVLNKFLTVTIYISIGRWGPVIISGFDCLYLTSA